MESNAPVSQYVPEHLWRYVGSSGYKDGVVLPSAFDLKNKTPPERYVSLQEGNGNTIGEKFISVVKVFQGTGWTLKRTGRLAVVDVSMAYTMVNVPNKIIEFKDERRPHYGLYYLSEDESLVLEAKSLLQLCSDLHDYNLLLSDSSNG